MTPIKGLYAVTPDLDDTERLCEIVIEAILGGATLVQYRNKEAGHVLRIAQAQALLAICRQHGVPLIINDHVKLCLALDADGVHIGGTDGDIAATRQRIGNKLLGASCYNRIDLALQAQAAGADYVAFGACFSSQTKPQAPEAALSLFNMNPALTVPKVAIGGITLDNAPQAVAAGADMLAVIGSLWGSSDIRRTAQQFSRLYNGPSSS
ncbi:thiamine phosphate synthase [Methylovorus sp. MP688]|uniref:thiamine phosphate synthase n=1 Tax=Methylovorus sp. (strain MP688) TaxID=887061 RepID=UPI0001EC4D2F|nr:thiamine phosphate synthase [Methylovorus sp. MP688]ADQ85883.1 thiamine-phosphate pyrophosphorylase [Methylovorus sp. MP688]